jgi:predicted SnoaL-like aldol condensation-catalyzing enzyme
LRRWAGLPALAFAAIASPAASQEAVTGVADPAALFTSPDPRLNANKQSAYHIITDLLGAGRWDEANQWLTERYVQDNLNIPSSRTAIAELGKHFPRPPAGWRADQWIFAVVAEGDYVAVFSAKVLPDPASPAKSYTTTHVDLWRFVDGKADEHWDEAQKEALAFAPGNRPPDSKPSQ